MNSTRRTATVTGIFFLVAAFPAMAALGLYQPVLSDPGAYVAGAGPDTGVLVGAFLEVLVAASVVGTAVTLYPLLRRQHSGFALGYVTGRLLEATVIVVGIISVLAVVTLRQDLAAAPGADDGARSVVAQALVAVHDWTFLFGPNFALGVNTVLLATLMYRSRLVPRGIAVLGLVGGPLIFASATAVLLGRYEQVSVLGAVAAVPVFLWEMSLALYLLAKGFRPGVSDRQPLTARAGTPVPA